MIVYRAADMMFASRIDTTADAAGVPRKSAHNVEKLQALLDHGDAGERVTAVFIDLDAGDDVLDQIRMAVAHDSRPTVIAFGSHVATKVLEAASNAGADQVMARSAFVSQLPDLLETYGHDPV